LMSIKCSLKDTNHNPLDRKRVNRTVNPFVSMVELMGIATSPPVQKVTC
jgi:hypothetical protein